MHACIHTCMHTYIHAYIWVLKMGTRVGHPWIALEGLRAYLKHVDGFAGNLDPELLSLINDAESFHHHELSRLIKSSSQARETNGRFKQEMCAVFWYLREMYLQSSLLDGFARDECHVGLMAQYITAQARMQEMAGLTAKMLANAVTQTDVRLKRLSSAARCMVRVLKSLCNVGKQWRRLGGTGKLVFEAKRVGGVCFLRMNGTITAISNLAVEEALSFLKLWSGLDLVSLCSYDYTSWNQFWWFESHSWLGRIYIQTYML